MTRIGYVIQSRGTAGPKEGEKGVLSATKTGIVISNFTVSDSDEVVDNRWGVVFLA